MSYGCLQCLAKNGRHNRRQYIAWFGLSDEKRQYITALTCQLTALICQSMPYNRSSWSLFVVIPQCTLDTSQRKMLRKPHRVYS